MSEGRQVEQEEMQLRHEVPETAKPVLQAVQAEAVQVMQFLAHEAQLVRVVL